LRIGGKVITTKIDRPLHLNNTSVLAQTTGTVIQGGLLCTSYVRAFRADFCKFEIGTLRAFTRSANASMSAGHNGILLVGCKGSKFGDCWIEESGEHAIRIGGSTGSYQICEDITFGDIVAIRPGGCVFKINPTLLVSAGVTEKATNIQTGHITGVDVGEGSLAGNMELLRLTHARRVRIASAIAYKEDETVSAQYALQINDCDDVEIGVLGGDALNSGFIGFDGESDCDEVSWFGGDVTDLRIGRLVGSCAGNNAILVDTAFNLGRIVIADMEITGFAVDLVQWNGGTLTDVFEINGRVYGAVVPNFDGVPTSANFQADIRYSNSRTMGRIDTLRFGSGSFQATQAAFSAANVVPTGFFANAAQATAGSGAYGGSYEMSRPGGNRRGAAIAAKQTSATAQDIGVAILGGAASAATDAVAELAVFKPSGTLNLPSLPVYADNAAALAGLLVAGDMYTTAAGAVRIVV
jgi:hypothetical protein